MDVFAWIILPLFIFFARVCDVTLGTIRIIFVSRGRRYLAPVFGFFEVLIWIVAISQIVRNLNNVACYLAYAAGFATGNFLGLLIEEKLALGMVNVRIFAMQEGELLTGKLHDAGYGVTRVNAHGWQGAVTLVFTIVPRKDLAEIVQLIQSVNPKLFFSVEEVRSASEGVFPQHNARPLASWSQNLSGLRKGK